MGWLLGAIAGLLVGSLTVITGSMEGKLSLRFIDGWVIPWASLWGVGAAGIGGVLWAFGSNENTGKGAVAKESPLAKFGYQFAVFGASCSVVTTVIAGGGHLALMALPDYLFNPNADMPVPEVKP